MDWNWEKLPVKEYNKALKALDWWDTEVLFDLHNKYKLSDNKYCCPKMALITFFQDAVNKNIIYATEENEAG